MKHSRRHTLRTFGVSLVLALCLPALCGACLLIDYNTRRMSYGRASFAVSYVMESGLPVPVKTDSGERVFDPSLWESGKALLGAPTRLWLWALSTLTKWTPIPAK